MCFLKCFATILHASALKWKLSTHLSEFRISVYILLRSSLYQYYFKEYIRVASLRYVRNDY